MFPMPYCWEEGALLGRLLGTAVLVIAGIGPALPQSKKGAPEEIIGQFGESSLECRSYHRRPTEMLSFTEDEYTWCPTNYCVARILGRRSTPSGFVLRLDGNPSWQITFIRKGEGVYEMTYQGLKTTNVIHRCRRSDSIAGIGLPVLLDLDHPDPNFSGLSDLINSPDGIFSASYARAVPSVCPGLNADLEKADAIIQLGRLGYLKLLLEGRQSVPEGRAPEEAADEHLKWLDDNASYAVKADAEDMGDFCKLVLDAFGPKGRVIANLLKE
jgi:hypothetical protein